MRTLLLSSLFFLFSAPLWGQRALIFDKQFEQADLAPYCRVLQIPDSTARPQEIAKLNPETDFENLLDKYPRFPHTKCSYWLTFSIENSYAIQRAFLIAANSCLYDIRLYQKSGDSLILLEAGGYGVKTKPPWDAIFYTFEIIPGKVGSAVRYYLFVNTGRTGTNVRLPMILVEGHTFETYLDKKNWTEGLFAGIQLIVFLMVVTLFLVFRTKATLWLLLLQLTGLIFLHVYTGTFLQIWWSEIHGLTRFLNSFTAALAQSGYILLYFHFNQLEKNAPKTGRFLKVFLTAGWIAFFVQAPRYFFDLDYPGIVIMASTSMYLVLPFTIFISSFWMAWQYKTKKYLVFPMAFALQIISGIWLTGMSFGFYKSDVLHHYIIIQLILLIDFVLFLAWFSYELIQLKSNFTNQQLALARSRAEAAENLLLGQQEERRRLRLRIHDGLGILLASTRMRLSKRAAEDETLRSIERDIAAAAAETRHLSHDLDPEPLQTGRLLDAIADTVGRAKSLSNATISFHFDQNLKEDLLPQHLKVALYYITQELLYNAIKHSEASEINLQLAFSPENKLLLRCSDNGIGAVVSPKIDGIGLENIRARVITVGGQFSMQERPGGGLVTEILVPL